MPLRQPIRTLLLATILVAAVVVAFNHSQRDLPAPPADEEVVRPVIRVARETQPTIVESDANWLDNVAEGPDRLDASSLPDPQDPEILPATSSSPDTSPSGLFLR